MKKSKSCTFYVSGMHCAACEVLIEKKLSKVDGVSSANVSLSDKKVEIELKKGSSENIDTFNDALFEHGYTLSSAPVGKAKWDQLAAMKAVAILIAFTVTYLILEDTKILAEFTVTESSGISAFFALGIVAGLSSCAALVGGILLSMSKQWNEMYGGVNSNKNYIPFALFNIGRLISFALFGAVLGFIGSYFQLSISITSILVIVVSFIMIVLGLQMLQVPWFSGIRFGLPSSMIKNISDEANFKGKYMPFVLGASTFFLPCGFTLLAQTLALTTGSPVMSSLMMTAFALGTLPMLAIISFGSIKYQKNTAIAGTFNLVVAIFIILFGIYNVNSQLNVLGLWSFSNAFASTESKVSLESSVLGAEVVEKDGKEVQIVNLEAVGFDYFPRNLTLKSDIETELIVKNTGVFGCAQAMYSAGLFDDVLYLQGNESRTTFTPQKGTYKISCTMGMVSPIFVEVI